MRRLVAVVLILAACAALAWWWLRPATIALPIANVTGDGVALEFYGAGLSGSVRVELAPRSTATASLALRREGDLRIRIVTPRLSNDALLLPDVAALKAAPQRFQIGPGQQFLLMADAGPRNP